MNYHRKINRISIGCEWVIGQTLNILLTIF